MVAVAVEEARAVADHGVQVPPGGQAAGHPFNLRVEGHWMADGDGHWDGGIAKMGGQEWGD